MESIEMLPLKFPFDLLVLLIGEIMDVWWIIVGIINHSSLQ